MTEPRRRLPPGYEEQLELGYVFGSVTTFAQRPLLTEPEQLDEWRPDVAVVGAPFDGSTTNRPGARFGPKAIRGQAYMPGTYHLDLGLEIFDHLEVVDYGDAYCPHGQTETSHANIHDRVHDVARRGIVPVVLGGDHSITWPAATAVADVHGHGAVGVVHFDAHADTADSIDGNLASHGTPMRRLIESGAVPGSHFVQVGLRGYWPPREVFEWMRDQGMRWHTMQEIWERGLRRGDGRRRLRGACPPPTASTSRSTSMPSTRPRHRAPGHPEPGGIQAADLLRMVRRLCVDHDVVGLDVVEVSPPYDVSDLTVNVAHRVVLEALAGMAHRRRLATGDEPGPVASN